MWNADQYWITIAEMPSFTKAAVRLLTPEEWDALFEYVALSPDSGELIADTGGIRFVRWPAESQGKSGNVRVVYFFRDLNTPVYLLALYERGELLNLSASEKRHAREIVEKIALAHGERSVAAYQRQNGAA